MKALSEQTVDILRRSPIFTALDPAELDELAALTREKRLPGGQTVFWEGDDSTSFYIVAEGKIRVSKLTSGGKEIILAFFGPGEMFGEVAVFENKPYPASARSVEATRLLGIEKAAFLGFLLTHPAVTLKIIAILSGRLRDAQERLRDLAGERVEQRLARLLLRLVLRLGPTLPFTRQELSDMAGTTTETTIRVLSGWNKRGITRSVRGKVTLIDEIKLKLLAQGPPKV